MNIFIRKIKPYGRLVNALRGFIYDFTRYYLFSAWRSNMRDVEQRSYNIARVYHALEKSMSFSNGCVDSGWQNASLLIDLLKEADRGGYIGYNDSAGLCVLKKFISMNKNKKTHMAGDIRKEIEKLEFCSGDEHGVKTLSGSDFKMGVLDDPECFFFSRYSLREFKDEVLAEDIIKRAISLALKTPSACNRQEWHVYHTDSDEVKSIALSHQTGNKGFGGKVKNLMILTSDLKAFMPGQEHYQHWIDGGMFSMSVVYALHSLGVASCCLNWSQSPANDKALRSCLNIKDSHTIIMLLAIGVPNEKNNVCVSERRPLEEFYSRLERKDVEKP
ncbi:MAG: nitroreductase family protein [Candidatus Scalindua sp.]